MKRVVLILVAAMLGVAFYGCKKECNLSPKSGYTIVGTGEDCYYLADESYGGGTNGGGGTTSTTGTMKFTNKTSYPFKLYIGGVFKQTVSGGSTYSYTDDAGTYTVKVEQSSGYYTYPLIETYTNPYIQAGYITSYEFPNATTGKIKVVSNSDNPYTLYINGANKGTIAGNSSQTVTVDAWHSYNVRVLQQSGYVLYPSEYTWTVEVDANYIYTKTYPTKAGGDIEVEIK